MRRTAQLLAGIAMLGACDTGPIASGDPATILPQTAEHAAASHGGMGELSTDVKRQLAELRRATAPFHNIDKAADAGWDIQVTPCWAHRTLGAMGYHYGKVEPPEWDVTVSLLDPELLMYEPGPGGHMRLVGMEYVVPKAAWDAISPGSPPMLLGEEFHPHSSLPIYKLHIWLWRDNSRGMFADWNPSVSCENAAQTDYFE